MKNKSLITALIYWFIMLGLVLYLSGCRTKKSSIDSNTKELENVSIIDKSKTDKKESVQETKSENKSESFNEKQFFESWMSFESDKITITDIHGTKTEITNPRINNKSSQTNDVAKTEQTDTKNEKASKNEENKQSDLKTDAQKQNESEFHSKENRETKIVWLWVIGGCVVGVFVYRVLKKIKLIKL